MENQKRSLLSQTKKQMNLGAIITGGGFVLYMAFAAMELVLAADLTAIVFTVVGVWNLLSVIAGRRRDKEAVSYSLLWGQGALTILLGAFAVLALKERLGL